MITAFTASTFFPKPLSRAGKRVKASMQKPFYHAFTTFTDTLQIDAYSKFPFTAGAHHETPRNNPLQPHKSAAFVCRYFAIYLLPAIAGDDDSP